MFFIEDYIWIINKEYFLCYWYSISGDLIGLGALS